MNRFRAPRLTRPAAALIACALAVPACSGTTPGLSNGSVSACYRAIPIGRAAVHEPSAHLVGVHRVAVDTVRRRLPPQVSRALDSENDSAVCVMAFRGSFKAGQVDQAPADLEGPYALVLVSSRKLRVVGAVVLDRLPKAFGGRVV